MSTGTSDNRRCGKDEPQEIRSRPVSGVGQALVYGDHLPGHVVNLLVRRAIRSDFHDVRLVLSQPRIDAQSVCLGTSVADRGVVRGRDRVRRVGDDADLVLAHGGGMRDEDVSRLHVRQ